MANETDSVPAPPQPKTPWPRSAKITSISLGVVLGLTLMALGDDTDTDGLVAERVAEAEADLDGEIEEARDEGYEDGYEDGIGDAEDEIDDAYDEGYADGQDDALAESDDLEPEPREILSHYLAKQAEATSAVLDGDESEEALERIDDINAEYVRYYTAEPGDPAGEWVHPNGEWLSSQGKCYDHLHANGMNFRDAQELCNATIELYSLSGDLHYWLDESNAEENRYWDEDRPVTLKETRDAVAVAEELS